MGFHGKAPLSNIVVVEGTQTVQRFAPDNMIPIVSFSKDDRNIEVIRPYLAGQARTGLSKVAAMNRLGESEDSLI